MLNMRRAAAHLGYLALLWTAFLPATSAGSVTPQGHQQAKKQPAQRRIVKPSPRTNASIAASAAQLPAGELNDVHPFATEFYGAAEVERPQSAAVIDVQPDSGQRQH